jgi:dihydroorotate dehydrogenase
LRNRILEQQGYLMESLPFAPAAGVINGLYSEAIKSQIRDVAYSPACAVTFGSITWGRTEGNTGRYKHTYHHNPRSGKTGNARGLPNVGHAEALEIYEEMQHVTDYNAKPLIPNISAGRGEDPLEVLPAMAYQFAEKGAYIVEVNYSCPNKRSQEGVREPMLGHDLGAMWTVDQKIREAAGSDILVVRKLPHYSRKHSGLLEPAIEGFTKIAQSKNAGRIAIAASNSIEDELVTNEDGEPALDTPDHLGGLSGPATKADARAELSYLRDNLSNSIGIISMLGVITGAEIHHRTAELGADFTEGATVLIENLKKGISYGDTIRSLAQEYYEQTEQKAA